MSTPIIEFAQPDETMPFGRRLKEIVKYLQIALPSMTGTFIATLPEEKRWRIEVHIPGRTFEKTTEPINFFLEAPNWSLGRSIAAHAALGRICEEYHKDLKGTPYRMCGRRDHQGEIVRTRDDDTTASYIQDLEEHIRKLENQMHRGMKNTRKLMTRKTELEDELKEAHDGHEEEIRVLLEKYEDLKKKLEEAEEKLDQGENIQEDNSDGCFISQDDDYEDTDDGEAGVDLMESSTDEN